MPDSQENHDQHDQQLDALIAEYYRAEAAGKAPDHTEFIARHPEFAKELAEFFGDVMILPHPDRPNPQDPALEPTITPNTSRLKNSPAASVVRYFGAYEILEDLGSGGMGVVYKARHLRLKKFVALKMIRAGTFASVLEVKMFEAEARAAAKLDHPGIVTVHEVGMHAGQHFYSMDYVAGGNLSKLHRDEPVPAKRAAELVKQLAEAVHYAHEQGIVHRDLKPANILLTTGVPRITDFGLAKRMWIGEDSVAVNMTETGQILGTPGYMSPEQAEGKTKLVGPPADIYALGAVLYALLTSRAPFVGESQAHIITQVIRNEPVSPRVLNPSVARDLETICLKCLNKEPHGRYGTAQLLADDLQRFLEGLPVLARPISRPARVWRWCRRNPWVSGLATAVAASLVIGSIVSTSLGVVAYKNSVESDKRGEALAVSLEDSQKKLAEIVKLTEERTVALDWSGDLGKLAVLRPGTVEIWLPRERRLLKSIAVPAMHYNRTGVRWSPDQRHLAVAIPDHKVVVIDSETGDVVSTTGEPLQPPTGRHFIDYIDWSPRGDCVAVSFGHCGLQLWKMESETLPIKSLEAYDGVTPRWIHWNPDQTTCVTISSDGWAMYWDTSDWSLLQRKKQLATNWCDDVAWSPDGTRVALASNAVLVADADGVQVIQLADQGARIIAVRWLDNERLVTANLAQELRIVRVDQKAPDKVFHLHAQLISGLSVGPDDQIASVAQGSSVKVWSPSDMTPECITLTGARLPRQSVAAVWHPQSTMLGLLSQEQSGNVAATWRPGARQLASIPFADDASSVYWSPPGDALIIETTDDRWESLPWPPVESVRPSITPQRSGPRYSSDTRFRVDAQFNTQQITIVDTLDPSSTIIPKVNTLYAFAWNPRNDWLAIAQHDFITLCHPQRDESAWVSTPWNPQFGVTHCLAWNHNGHQLLVGGHSGLIHVLDGGTLDIVHILRGHAGALTAVGCSNDGKRIVSAGLDGFLRWWDAAKGVELFKLPIAKSESLCELRFSDDGRWLAGRAEAGKVYVWTNASPTLSVNAAPAPVKAPSLGSVNLDSELAGPVELLNSKIVANPDDSDLYIRRGHWYAVRQRWREACVEYELSLVRRPEAWWCRSDLARLYLYLTDQLAYERHCKFLHEQLRSQSKGINQCQMMRPHCLDPNRWSEEIAAFDPIAERFLSDAPDNGEILRTMIELRYIRHRWQECIDATERLVPNGPKHVIEGYPWLYRIMALHQLGRTDEAKRALNDFKTMMESQRLSTPYNDGYDNLPLDRRLKLFTFNALEAQIVYREATQLILDKPDDLNFSHFAVRDAPVEIDSSLPPVKFPNEQGKPLTLAELTAAIEAQPESVEARLRRGQWYRQGHLWAEALADLVAALDAVAGTHYWDRSALAALHLRQGNIDADRKICRELVAEMHATPDDVCLADMVRLVCLSPVGVDDFAPIREMSNTLMARRDNEFFQRNQVSVLCRLKLWKEAVEAARTFRTKYKGGLGPAQPMLFQAIAFQNLGETDAARELLIEAKEYAEAQSPDPKDPVDWFSLDVLYTEIAFAEASELILGKRQELSLKHPAADSELPR